MRTAKLSAIILICASFVFVNGCGNELADLRRKNQIQQDTINDLSAQLKAAEMERNQFKTQLDELKGSSNLDVDTRDQRIAALEQAIKEKDDLIAKMRQSLLTSQAPIPVELSTLLEDFANSNSMVTYDSERGIVKFSSDLLFNKGSDEVTTQAAGAVKSLCAILNTSEAQDFDVVVAGHTDDIPIQKPETLKNHPTNWHLSVHRAISVEKIMETNGVSPQRLSVRGFGQYRPIVDNAPNKGGAEQNRRVEIYIVPKGA